tara:strand:- start:4340 stop:4534 length:195 start_codon:yes stop_codon:yes gene_type:complete
MYTSLEKIIARAIDYPIGETDDDTPKTAILQQKQAKVGLYIKLIEKFVAWATCFFIVAGVLRHW